jgi:hypothetical protein
MLAVTGAFFFLAVLGFAATSPYSTLTKGRRMSHIVSIETKVHDHSAVLAACHRLNLKEPVFGKAELFSGEASGLLLRLPDWEYPVVIDTLTGTIRYDNYEGSWGEQKHLDRFLQMYAVEKAKLEARKKGYTVNEQALNNGSIKVQIIEGS